MTSAPKLLDVRTKSGSRQFAEMPDPFGPLGWATMHKRIRRLPGMRVTKFLNSIPQAILDFEFRGYLFTVDTQFGDLWLFVANPECPDEHLLEVVRLFRIVCGSK